MIRVYIVGHGAMDLPRDQAAILYRNSYTTPRDAGRVCKFYLQGNKQLIRYILDETFQELISVCTRD